MDFALTEEQTLIAKTARDFAQRRLAPMAKERDARELVATDEHRELGKLGLLGVNVPEAWGGSEAGTVAFSLVMQELSRVDAAVAVEVSVTNMVAELIARFGRDAQRDQHVRGLCSGDYIAGSFALSEPQAGSDPAALSTRAEKVAGGWRLTGTKQWITSGDRAGIMVVWAVTDAGAGHRGLSAFLVPGGAEGLAVSKSEDKMGLRGSATVQLSLDGVEVGDDALLGELGDGFKLAMVALDGGRIGISSQALGISRGALEAATQYALERETFGVPIAKHQAIGNMLADCATWLESGTWLTLRAAWLKQSGKPFTKQAAMAKLFASERASQICDLAIQIHGGYGYTRDFPVERAYRDARVTRIYEGTSEIQRIVIARQVLREMAG